MAKAESAEKTENVSLHSRLGQIFQPEQYFRHVPVGQYLNSGLGGIAEYLVIANNTGELVAAAKAALAAHEPYLVIAKGTGSLVSHVGFPGLVIINQTSNIICSQTNSEVLVDSGVSNAKLVNTLASKGLGAVEFLLAIPGTIGGAVVTNAYYQTTAIRSYVKDIVLFVPSAAGGDVLTLSAAELSNQRGVRLFERAENSPIILSVRLQLASIAEVEILRRLALYGKTYQRNQRLKFALGYVVTPKLAEVAGQKTLRVVTLPKGVRFGKDDLDILEFNATNTPEQLRQALTAITLQLREHGVVLEERLAYLGYWPSKEEDSTTSNTESF